MSVTKFAKDLNTMAVGDVIGMGPEREVMAVPTGWIFTMKEFDDSGIFLAMTSTFVPRAMSRNKGPKIAQPPNFLGPR